MIEIKRRLIEIMRQQMGPPNPQNAVTGGAVDRSNQYSFEESNQTKREVADDDRELLAFSIRLNISPLAMKVCEKDIKSFVLYVIHSINWYHDAVAKEYELKRTFFRMTLAIAGAMPIFAAVLPAFLPDTKSVGYGLIAGLLSGLLGLQRTLGTWLKHRNVEAVFNEAAAQLKEILYALEDKWTGVLPPIEDRARERAQLDAEGREFVSELDRMVKMAREILAEERVKYYETAAPVIRLQKMRPSLLSGSDFSSDTPIMAKFTFEAHGFTEEEKRLILRNHKLAYACIDGCEHLSTEQKNRLFESYKGPIEHYPINVEGIYAEALVGGVTIGVNKELLLTQPEEREIAQTLIHEMMHCAGYNHPPKTDQDMPDDNGGYYGSPPLVAERCIAGLQSDLIGEAYVPVHECKGNFGNCQIMST